MLEHRLAVWLSVGLSIIGAVSLDYIPAFAGLRQPPPR